MVEAESIGVDRLAHVDDAVGAQDVEREGANPRKDARFAADAAVVLAQDAVAHVVSAVLDPPVGADSPAKTDRVKRDLAGIIGDLLARLPQAGARVFAPGQAGDARHAGDEGLPLGREMAGYFEELDTSVLLPAMAGAVHRLVPIHRHPPSAEGLDRLKQFGLVVLDADQQRVAGTCGAGEGPF
jgi:hypothetical protein